MKPDRFASTYPKKVSGQTITGTVEESFHDYRVRVQIMDEDHHTAMIEWCREKGEFDASFSILPEIVFEPLPSVFGIRVSVFFNARFRTKEDAALFKLFHG